MQNVQGFATSKLSLKSVILTLWHRKLFIIVVTLIFSVAGVALALYLPAKYKAEVMVAPSKRAQGSGLSSLAGQLGGLAGLAGVNLGSGDQNNVKLALQILKSRSFLIDFIRKNELEVPVFAAQGWQLVDDKLLINEKIYDITSQQWVREVKSPRTPEPSDQELYGAFSKMLDVKIDTREGTYRIAIEHFSPNLAQQWANALVHEINKYMRTVDIQNAQRSIDYLQKQLEKSNYSSMEIMFFNLIEEQTKKAMLAEVQQNYVFEIIDPALAPEKKSQPKRPLICILFFLFGGLLSCSFVLVRHYWSEID